MQQARARVSRLKAQIEALDKVANREAYGPALEIQCHAPERPTAASQAAYENCVKTKQNEGFTWRADQGKRVQQLARMREELAVAERSIDEIEDDARRAGALPGWLRE
jgi:hypothetical protein